MMITTTDFEVMRLKDEIEVLGIVTGNTVRSKNIGKDIMAGLKNLIGGELQEYTKMLAEAREESLNRMINDANRLGADAVLNVRFTTSQTMSGAAELLAYGTAIKHI